MKKPADWPSDLCYAAPSTESIYSSYQEDEWWVPDESNGSGELAFVSSTVSARWFVCILGQLQLFQCPLHHLQGVKSNVSCWNSAVQAMKETTVGYPPLMWNCITFIELFQYLILSLYSLSYMLGLTLTVSMGLLLNNCAISKSSCRLTCLHVLLAVLSG